MQMTLLPMHYMLMDSIHQSGGIRWTIASQTLSTDLAGQLDDLNSQQQTLEQQQALWKKCNGIYTRYGGNKELDQVHT